MEKEKKDQNKKTAPMNEVLSFRVTNEEKKLIDKNPWIKKEIHISIREYIQAYL